MAIKVHEETRENQGHSEELVQLAHTDRMGALEQLGSWAAPDAQGQQVSRNHGDIIEVGHLGFNVASAYMYIQMYERKEIIPSVEVKERMLRFVLTGMINFMWLILTKPSYMVNLHYNCGSSRFYFRLYLLMVNQHFLRGISLLLVYLIYVICLI